MLYETENNGKAEITMRFLATCVNIIRIIFIILTIYYILKRDFKKLVPVIITFALTFLPALLDRAFKLRADAVGNLIYYAVIVMSVYLGGGLRFYDKYAWWDRVLHFLCGIMFVSFGVPLAYKMGMTNRVAVLFFCFTLSTTLHALWEAAEYIIDTLVHTDHQRWQEHSKSKNHLSPDAVQPAGLVDTMNDIIICMIGTVAACAVWWFII